MNEEILALINGEIESSNKSLSNMAQESKNKLSQLFEGGLNFEELAQKLEELGEIDSQIEEIESLLTEYIDGSNPEELEAQKQMLTNIKAIRDGATGALETLQLLFEQLHAEEGFTQLANRALQLLAQNYNLPNDTATLEMIKKFLHEGGDLEKMIAEHTAEATQKITEPESKTLPKLEDEIITTRTPSITELIREKA